MRPRRLAALLALLCGVTAAWTARRADTGFPHAKHAKLFPTCLGCHAGITTGDSAAMYPAVALCARCHDGTIEKTVSWTGAAFMATNLRFSHTEHARDALQKGDTLRCATCHEQANGAGKWMAVGPPRPETCITCHTHRAPEHLAAEAKCATCHVPLAQARTLTASAIGAFPRPASHERADFLESHAPSSPEAAQSCATCHARESCERCHVNSGMLAAVNGLAPDARVASLMTGRRAVYPVPDDHRTGSWAYAHAGAARRDVASCANCHARSSCTTCHIGAGGATLIARLPLAQPGKAQGVVLRDASAQWPAAPPHTVVRPSALDVSPPPTLPASRADTGRGGARRDTAAAPRDSGGVHRVRVHWPGFVTAHGSIAATGQMTCSNCHQQSFCTSCHDGESRTQHFHPANFLARHAVEAYGRESDCARCHSPEAFCRSCHLNTGMAVRGRNLAAFHTGQPLWLLQHGQAARQSLESCVSCHQQRDCMRCHSTLGWGVNPHGPGFDARRMQSKNRLVCLECHVSDPLGGSGTTP